MRLEIEDFKKKFESMIYQRMLDNNVPGCSFTIFKDEDIIYSRGFGSRNIQESLPYTSDTIAGFTSGGKSFTALAILLLQEEGKLSIEDPISKYLPLTVGRENYPIRIKHLLSHSSGLPSLGHGERDYALFNHESGVHILPLSSWDDFFYNVNGANSEIFFNPGEHFYYCNTGFILLGEIIHRVSGLKYPEYVKEKITSKLDMGRTRFLESSYDNNENISMKYVTEPNSKGVPYPKPISNKFDEFIYGAGGIYSSTAEMTKYIMMIGNNGKVDGKQVFSERLIEELTIGHVQSNIYTEYGDVSYCYGWFRIENFLGDTLVLHGGGGIGTGTQMAYLKNNKIGIIASSNFGPLPDNEVINAFCLLLGKNKDEEFSFIKRNRHLQRLAGDYILLKGIDKIKVIFEGGKLFKEDYKTPLFPKSESLEELNFYVQTSNTKFDVNFIIDEKDKIHFIYRRWVYHKLD